jgi:hypothetical protein
MGQTFSNHPYENTRLCFASRVGPAGKKWAWTELTISLYPQYLIGIHDFSVVGKATGYGLDDRGVGVRVPVEARFFSSARRPDRFWDPPNLLSNGYRGLFPQG